VLLVNERGNLSRNGLRPVEVDDHDEIKAKVKLRAAQWLASAMTAVVHRKHAGFSHKIMVSVACSAEPARRLAMSVRRDLTQTASSSATADDGWCDLQK